jgi:hypothetical protein
MVGPIDFSFFELHISFSWGSYRATARWIRVETFSLSKPI